ncbi:hypothetical protein L1987_05550 [Smallanthus sonchifolius]|uniref:Uncharacterized protein n=1 Tax=Smallanthus sonchifolius TaxID=185202 RepID=A0ACB9JVN5_9ASTR|nr:hypothetical protein L1987_05550 [Smallanthus sonchifolius]
MANKQDPKKGLDEEGSHHGDKGYSGRKALQATIPFFLDKVENLTQAEISKLKSLQEEPLLKDKAKLDETKAKHQLTIECKEYDINLILMLMGEFGIVASMDRLFRYHAK